MTPWYAAVMLQCGWINFTTYEVVYNTMRREAAVRHILGECEDCPQFVCSTASLVPLMRGQFLMLGLQYVAPDGRKHVLDCVELVALDGEHGDDLDLPPHGLPSELSQERAPGRIAKFLRQVRDGGLGDVFSLMLGQGLMEMQRRVEDELRGRGIGPLMVYLAASTSAGNYAMGL